jgi:hypothetical protein
MNLREKYLENIQTTYENALDLVYTKSQDYASNDDPFKNFREAAQFAGITLEQGIFVRLGDKFARVKNLLEKGESAGAVGEAIEDTLLDICNYTAILKTWIDLGRPRADHVQLSLALDEPPFDADPGDENDADIDRYVDEGWRDKVPTEEYQPPQENWFKKLFGLG